MQVLELPLRSVEKIRPLVHASGMRGHLALVYEVFEGRRGGQVFVDQLAHPHTALLCGASGFYFAFGEPNEIMLNALIMRLMKTGPDENYTTLFGSSPTWNDPLQHAFEPYKAQREKRLAFELFSMPEEPAIPHEFALQPINARLAQSILDGSGTGGFGIDPWFVRSAGGAETYAALGLGLALIQNGQIASLCGVCGLGGGEAELEVGTVPAFRGRGLAAIVSAAFMWQCQARGLQPAYSCGSDNIPSIAVAHRLGYGEIEEIQGYKLYEPGMRH
jgi:GNAT superfamily N-acetyltransferase